MRERRLMWRVVGMTARFLAMAALPCVSMGSAVFAVRNVTLIDGTGRAPIPDAVLVVKGDRIVAAGASGAVMIPKGARTVRFPGKYVIPGLMDANVHLYYWLEPEHLIQHEGHYEAVILEAAQLALRYGVTTVFDTWGPRAALAAVRDQINSGAVPGSRVFIAGNIIGLDGPLSADFRMGDAPLEPIFDSNTLSRINSYWTQTVGGDLLWLEAKQVRVRIRDYIAAYRPDFLKYAGSAHGADRFIAFSQEAQNAIVAEGRSAGLTVQAHTSTPEALKMAIAAGADILTHCSYSGTQPISAETVQEIAKRQIPCTPLFETEARVAWWRDNPPAWWPAYSEVMQVQHRNDRALVRAGAVLAMATDGGGYSPLEFDRTRDDPDVSTRIGEAAMLWLQAAQQLGMTPMDALLSATRNVAAAYRRDQDLGTLEPGKIADLVVLDGDPLADVRNYRRIYAILKTGRFVDLDALPVSPMGLGRSSTRAAAAASR